MHIHKFDITTHNYNIYLYIAPTTKKTQNMFTRTGLESKHIIKVSHRYSDGYLKKKNNTTFCFFETNRKQKLQDTSFSHMLMDWSKSHSARFQPHSNQSKTHISKIHFYSTRENKKLKYTYSQTNLISFSKLQYKLYFKCLIMLSAL